MTDLVRELAAHAQMLDERPAPLGAPVRRSARTLSEMVEEVEQLEQLEQRTLEAGSARDLRRCERPGCDRLVEQNEHGRPRRACKICSPPRPSSGLSREMRS